MEILVKTYRGPLEDLFHTGHIAVVDSQGKLLYSCGDPDRVCYARSSAKPIQALCVLESGAAEKFGLDDQDIALFCASHNGEPMHVEAVRRALAKAGLDEGYLQCGVHYPLYEPEADRMKAEGIEPRQIHCNCSGKHTGMLVTAAALGEELDSYYKPEHPVQRRACSRPAPTGLCPQHCPDGRPSLPGRQAGRRGGSDHRRHGSVPGDHVGHRPY